MQKQQQSPKRQATALPDREQLRRTNAHQHRQALHQRQQRRKIVQITAVTGIVIALLAWIYIANSHGQAAGTNGSYPYQVAAPGPGLQAPDFTLTATNGQQFHLADYRGKSVLLYFQEGIGCEGCWTQVVDMERQMSQFRALGIDTMLTITTNPLAALRQKVADEGITLPVLSDPNFTVSTAYDAMAYGMMSGAADGHTFLLVGPDGQIRWRGDFGGPPNYTMYVPVATLLRDLQEAIHAQ